MSLIHFLQDRSKRSGQASPVVLFDVARIHFQLALPVILVQLQHRSSHSLLIRSIKEKLLPLGDDCEVYAGHGPPTLIGRERLYNPFLREEGPATGSGGIIIP